MIYILSAIIILLLIVIMAISFINRRLKKEIGIFQELIALKDTTISNLKASRVTVKDLMENIFSIDKVMSLIGSGHSRESISKQLNMPLSKIETIIKLDSLKKEKKS